MTLRSTFLVLAAAALPLAAQPLAAQTPAAPAPAAAPEPASCKAVRFSATAAPVAIGMPSQIEPPLSWSQVWGAASRVRAKKLRPVVIDSSQITAPSGIRAPSTCPIVS